MLTLSFTAVPEVRGQPTVVGRTQTSITLSFTPSTGQVNTYQVEYYERRGFSSDYLSGAVIQNSNGQTLQITQDNLQPDTSYQFRIVPYLSTNRGKSSDPVITATLGNYEKVIYFYKSNTITIITFPNVSIFTVCYFVCAMFITYAKRI